MARDLPSAIATMLDDAARRYGLPPALLRGLAWTESRGVSDAVSRAGAQGVMQLMPATARGLGVSNPFDPAENIDAGARFFARLLKRFGTPERALAAYNWGPRRVADGRTWPDSVRRYVRKVLDRAQVEDERLAARGGPRLALDEGDREAAIPFDVEIDRAHGGPPWPLACFPPPHCRSCTCEPEGGTDDA